ncbi:MAG: zinc-ribbon domain-containing protein [Clostridia bacterium]|nr:zinc-ribbon domain-containing protein [Clostridia bacterium]
MYCKNCGKEVNENAVICPNCGVPTDNYTKSAAAPEQKNTLALVGFILSFFVTIAGLVISIIAYKNAKKPEYNGDGKNFALAGIIISAVSLGLSLILGIIYSVIWINFIYMLPMY